MNKPNLNYTYTRLEILGVATVYVAVNETKSVLEIQEPVLLLDNEITKNETSVQLSQREFKILNEYFESMYGKKLDKIDIESMSLLCCREIVGLEDEHVFVTIEESIAPEEENEILYTMTLTEKCPEGRYHSIKLSKEAYVALVPYCRR